MKAFVTVFTATVREHARRKVIVFFAAITALVTVVGIILARNGRQLVDILGGSLELHELLSVGILGLVTTVAALILSMGTIRPALATGEAEAFLTRPVSRAQWALARIAAAVVIVSGLVALAALGSMATALASKARWSSDMLAHWGTELFGLVLLCLMTAAFSGWFKLPALAAVSGYLADQAVGAIHAFYPMVAAGDIRGPIARFLEVAWVLTPKVLPSPLLRTVSGGPQLDVSVWLVLWASAWLVALIGVCVWRAQRSDAG